MSPLILVWFVFASITSRGIYYDLKSEVKVVELFKQTDFGYEKYSVEVKP